jgi:hypothetical protein
VPAGVVHGLVQLKGVVSCLCLSTWHTQLATQGGEVRLPLSTTANQNAVT